MSWLNRAAAADLRVPARRLAPSSESTFKVVHLRKLARQVFHWGNASQDESPIQLGPAALRVFWQKKWKWPEPSLDPKSACGLLGGPMLSLGLPLRVLGQVISIETRLSSLRYAYADLRSARMLLEELSDPRTQRQSVEAVLYLTLPLAKLF